MKYEEFEYINQSTSPQRCTYTFAVDEQLNLVMKTGEVKIVSTRGKRCGLESDPASIEGYCYWHKSDPNKAKDPKLRERLENAVQQHTYLGGSFLRVCLKIAFMMLLPIA